MVLAKIWLCLIAAVCSFVSSLGPRAAVDERERLVGTFVPSASVAVEIEPLGECVIVRRPSTAAECGKWFAEIDRLTKDSSERIWLKRVMSCESGCREGVVSRSGVYKGLYQYDGRTWGANCVGDILSGRDQIGCTLRLYREGQVWRWPTCHGSI